MTHPTRQQLAGATWTKSSYSGGAGNECVEVAHVPGWVAIRDSKNPAGPALAVPPAAFQALLARAAAGGPAA